MSIETIKTGHGVWEILHNNDGMWQAIPQSLQLPFLEADTIGGISYKVHTFVPEPKDVEIVSALEPTAIRYAANIGTPPKKEEQPVKQEKKPFPSVGVAWGDYTRGEIQEFLDWCVGQGARPIESVKAFVGYLYDLASDYAYFGVDDVEETRVSSNKSFYTTIVNTIEEAKELISKELGLEEPQEVIVPLETPIKSDGGSSAYYRFSITSSITGETMEVETGDVIRGMVDNDFDLGNIIKACRRISQALKGKGKEGIDVEYDANKIVYFAEQLKKGG